jgi:hypothetical protein
MAIFYHDSRAIIFYFFLRTILQLIIQSWYESGSRSYNAHPTYELLPPWTADGAPPS